VLSSFNVLHCLFILFIRVDGPSATGGVEDNSKQTTGRPDNSSGSFAVQQTNKEVAITTSQQSDDKAAVWSTPELVDAILEENFALRQQVQAHKDNIAKLQKVHVF
jgi:hypothetical protein